MPIPGGMDRLRGDDYPAHYKMGQRLIRRAVFAVLLCSLVEVVNGFEIPAAYAVANTGLSCSSKAIVSIDQPQSTVTTAELMVMLFGCQMARR